MIIDFFINNLKVPQVYFVKDIRINIGINKKTLSISNAKKYVLTIMLEMKKEQINEIVNIFDFIISEIRNESSLFDKISIIANWYLFMSDITEEHFYKITIKENRNYRNMYNTFVLIDSDNGETFFNPGKIGNKVISERIKFLYMEYEKEQPLDKEKEKIFGIEIHHLFEVLEVVLNDMYSKVFIKWIK
jgi:hypothetical protein